MAIASRCPECNHWVSHVVDTSVQPDDQVIRRRVCRRCNHRWFTIQLPEVALKREQVLYRNKKPTLR